MQGEIVAFEGPSGSGKSYHLAIWESEGYRVLRRTPSPRVNTNGFGAWSSAGHEYTAIAAATMEPDVPVFVDRFLLSRWVYRALQFNRGVLTDEWQFEMIRSLRRMLSTASNDKADRMYAAPGLYPKITINVLLPSLEVLYMQRRASGKEYPFDAEQELTLYHEVSLLQSNLYKVNIL